MPELPEVETIKNELTPHVVGRCIKGVTLYWEGMVAEPSPQEFVARIKGQCVSRIARRGKYLIFSLSGGQLMIIHLKMSGALLLGPDSSQTPNYTRAVIHLDDGNHIFFRDPRKFGRMRLAGEGDTTIGALGPEPLEDSFILPVLQECLSKRRGPIKAVLLDQAVIAGIGNMYADEALFDAGIHPFRSANSLSEVEIKRLYYSIRRILTDAIGAKGASVNTYLRPGGQKGKAHFEFKVAHKRGEKCSVCEEWLQRLVVRGRSSYFCPRCQS
jgi:formamidopyrimidine-DNA glycosylase